MPGAICCTRGTLGGSPAPAPSQDGDGSVDLLAVGFDAFMCGSLWLEAARSLTEREQQRMIAASVLALLAQAQRYLYDAAPSEEQRQWGDELGRSVDDARALA